MTATVSPPPSKRRKLSGPQYPRAKQPESLTIYSHNVNGIAPYLQRSITSFFRSTQEDNAASEPPKASLRDALRRYGWPTMLFLQEIKLSPDDGASIRAVEKAVKSGAESADCGPDYVAHVCLPSDKYNARGFGRKIYGVATIIRKDFSDDFVERVRMVSWDVEGRFLVCETRAVGSLGKLAIWNIYAVNGTDLPYKHPGTGHVRGTRHDRKLAVHEMLANECRELGAQGFGVILAGDMNIARSPLDGHPRLRTFPYQHCVNRADFEKKFFSCNSTADDTAAEPPTAITESQATSGLGMIDTFRHLHGDTKGYTYYPRGKTFSDSCDRVDMVMASSSMGVYLKEAGILATAADRGPSDHVPLFARFVYDEAEAREPSHAAVSGDNGHWTGVRKRQ